MFGQVCDHVTRVKTGSLFCWRRLTQHPSALCHFPSSLLIHPVLLSSTHSINTLSCLTPCCRRAEMSPSASESLFNLSHMHLNRQGSKGAESVMVFCSLCCEPHNATGTEKSQQQKQQQVCRDLGCRSCHVLHHRGSLQGSQNYQGDTNSYIR